MSVKMLRVLVLFAYILALSRAMKVVVTGAAGRTGSLVTEKLLLRGVFTPLALVRTEGKGKKVASRFKKITNLVNWVRKCDTTNIEELDREFKGADKVILCTSAVPKIKFLSIIKILLVKVFGRLFGIKTVPRPQFYFAPNGDPYNVDWLGAKYQIDAAKRAGVKHFIFVSSMGGTQPENFLNTIGKVEGDEKSGNILLWKRKAEEYLIASGLQYTIIHPGGLTDKAGGKSEIKFGVDDQLLQESSRQIPRADVAEICVEALVQPGAINRSIDVIAKESDKPTADWKDFFSKSGNCKY